MSQTRVAQVETGQEVSSTDGARIVLKLSRPATRRQVAWREDTVDNEHLNRRKSKCCCIYEKPREFGESSSDSDDDGECANCRGHKQRPARVGPPAEAQASGSGRRVGWSADTVDNENMGKRKSKCCCIYEKPRQFGESSSESDDDECANCRGHVELRRAAPSAD
ncbi:unnamed protein product [Ixodes hexagonus]